jgi:multicomponent Na+:H+ antiporter subunit E
MKALLWNILLALIWIMVTGAFTFPNLVFGLVAAYFVLWVLRQALGETTYFSKVWVAGSFLLYFIKELVVSALRVAYDVVTPQNYMRPAIVAIPLTLSSNLGLTLLANMITLTPGTLSLDISDDRKTLYVHAMYCKDPEKFRAEIKNNYEARILELLR